MSIPLAIEKAHEVLNARRPTLRCNMFNYTVEVLHGDHSHFVFQNATCRIRKIYEHDMLLVWTEHCGYHAFFLEDLEFWRKYEVL